MLLLRIVVLCFVAIVATGCAKSPLFRFVDVRNYEVRDPKASYFNMVERRNIVRASTDPVLAGLRPKLISAAPSCEAAMAIKVQDGNVHLPTFYGNNALWRQEIAPFWNIAHAVSRLAGANLIAEDRRHAECLLDVLMVWAERDALMEFTITNKNKQSWFQIEATLFSMGLALAAVRPDLEHRQHDLKFVDAWLIRAAKNHLSIEGGKNGTCCNNHFYRRALHATIIGVMGDDDRLFRVGVKSIYMAIQDATKEGGLPLELKRGDRAAHYQNFSVMYLVMIAQIIERQGYPIWDLEIEGKTLHTLVEFNNRLLLNPNLSTQYSGTDEVYLDFMDDQQYFAWMEIYLSRFQNHDMENMIAERRPLYNRSLGGHLTAYFYKER